MNRIHCLRHLPNNFRFRQYQRQLNRQFTTTIITMSIIIFIIIITTQAMEINGDSWSSNQKPRRCKHICKTRTHLKTQDDALSLTDPTSPSRVSTLAWISRPITRIRHNDQGTMLCRKRRKPHPKWTPTSILPATFCHDFVLLCVTNQDAG